MQRPTTSGRRHNRTGSVTVAELIRKQPAPVRIRTREQAATHGLVADLLREENDTALPGRRPTRTAKLAGVTTGAVVLLASIAATAVLAGNRPAGPDGPRVEPPAAISGSAALRPDLLSAGLGAGRPDGVPAQARLVAPTAVYTPAEPPMMVPPTQVDVGPEPQVDIVRKFFELLPANPTQAARLLSPELLGGSRRDFVESWDHVQAITIESTSLRPDGAVLAVVSMQERTGRWMRVEQLFRLTDTSVPRIVATEVLSAQRG
ncbi:hypothetical protein [Saccharothrix texasensis]|uniref:Uncharacterized protein n=1 Tax=Saccharothrix texasensis TaxID=103734 RepID=A0A3N1HBU6_9PSEU|nr:hypothetical protein [Saccharothrix texasensis]ROP39971.1 hypothetical protein EDD40_5373 [Saccharothrix texasensis]